ncbi:MAG: tRNA (pseudouridine(54)-N(1))-methyltransferase TrmY [Deltaproteobacteria bacterium]|nr:tRNA (pseudouridine(54)-N(1))-methyltransferase TrmY [Deltaproteobacteria bacterium]
MNRSFVVVGTKATASPSFSLLDIAGTSGRLDVLLRCARSALLVSHGMRREARIYLVLQGGDLAPRVVRIDGAEVRFLRPDERALATLAQKVLTEAKADAPPGEFIDVRPGVAVARGDIEVAIADLARRGPFAPLLLEEGAADLREAAIDPSSHVVVFVGDHFGFDERSQASIAALEPLRASLGPVSVHADDAVAVVSNELDRRAARSEARAR